MGMLLEVAAAAGKWAERGGYRQRWRQWGGREKKLSRHEIMHSGRLSSPSSSKDFPDDLRGAPASTP